MSCPIPIPICNLKKPLTKLVNDALALLKKNHHHVTTYTTEQDQESKLYYQSLQQRPKDCIKPTVISAGVVCITKDISNLQLAKLLWMLPNSCTAPQQTTQTPRQTPRKSVHLIFLI